MHTRLSAAALLALAIMSGPIASGSAAQQTSGQDASPDGPQAHETTSTNWATSGGVQPEQAGDLYQAKTRANDNFGSTAPSDSTLPGALNPSTDLLDNGRRADPRD